MKRLSLLLLVLVAAFTLSACAKDSSGVNYEASDYSDTDTTPDEPIQDPDIPELNGGEVLSATNLPNLVDRKIIYMAELEIEAPDPAVIYEDVVALLDVFDAYVEGANITQNVYVVKIRILSSQFTDFVEAVKENGDIISFQKTSQDVTNEYSILEARKTALEAYHARLVELIVDASFAETIQLMEEQYDVETELNQINQSLSNFNSLVDYSTLDLTIVKAVETTVILPKTSTPYITVDETSIDGFIVTITNTDTESVVINFDVFQNGEFVHEYEETAVGESTVTLVLTDLDSNTEYKLKATTIAAEHRLSEVYVQTTTTESTFFNNIGNVFTSSLEALVGIFEYIGYFLVAILPFAMVGAIFFGGYKLLVIKFPQLKRVKRVATPTKYNTITGELISGTRVSDSKPESKPNPKL